MYKKKTSSFIKHFDFHILSMLSIEIAFILAYFLRMQDFAGLGAEQYRIMLLLLPLLQLGVSLFQNEYKDVLRKGYWESFKSTVASYVAIYTIVIVFLFVTKTSESISRVVVSSSFGFGLVLSYSVRLVRRAMIKKYYGNKSNDSRRIMVVADRSVLDETLDQLQNRNFSDFTIVGISIPDEEGIVSKEKTYRDITIYGSGDQLVKACYDEVVDEVFINCSLDRYNEHEQFAQKLVDMGLVIHMNLDFMDDSFPNKTIERIAGYTVMTSGVSTATFRQLFIKRAMDIAGGIVGSIITLILMVFIGPIIFIQSPGPIFFKQTRVGKNGRHFKIFKFRSMYMDAEERKKELMEQNKMDGFMFKMDNDPRVIPIGRFIRKYSLDEFPQFFNVLIGDMSLVGTRPPTVDEVEQYELHHMQRLAIKPGITGMWQVSGRSNITDFDEVVKLDTEYIQNWSNGLDIKILFKTVKELLHSDSAV